MNRNGRHRSALFVAIRKQAHRLFRFYKVPRAQAPCMDCGGSEYMVWDHRDYSDVLDVAAVCNGCNERRGAALIEIVDPNSLEKLVIST